MDDALLELFAGYGGLGMAVERALDVTTTHVVEYDPAPSRILAHRFPHAPNLHDVTTVNWYEVPRPKAMSGGSPCPDLATCGRRAGMVAGTRSGLWESMREGVAVLRPQYVVWENVRGALTAKASSAMDPDARHGYLRALGRVLGDLASLGYDAEWAMVRASDVGACHQRARVFLLAWDRHAVPSVHPTGRAYASWDELGDTFHDLRGVRLTSRAGVYRDRMPTDGAMRGGMLYPREPLPAPDLPGGTPELLLPTPRTTDTNGAGVHGKGGMDLRTVAALHLVDGWGEYGPAVERHAMVLGREAPAAVSAPLRDGAYHRLSDRFVEWVQMLPAGWVTDEDLELTRAQRIRALGNGVVPPQAEHAVRGMRGRMLEPVVHVVESAPELAGALW